MSGSVDAIVRVALFDEAGLVTVRSRASSRLLFDYFDHARPLPPPSKAERRRLRREMQRRSREKDRKRREGRRATRMWRRYDQVEVSECMHHPRSCAKLECAECGIRDCPGNEWLHYDKDGCPYCYHEGLYDKVHYFGDGR